MTRIAQGDNTGGQSARRQSANQAMERYARGEAAAFDCLYALVSDELWGFIFARVRDQAAAEDLMQQTLLQMHGSRGRFRSGASVHPWMFTIAWRLIIDRSRRARPQVEVYDLGLVDPEAQPDEQASATELCGRLRLAYGALPARQRAALELVRASGLSHRETADVLGTSESAVKSLLHRALTALRDSRELEEV